MKRHEWWREQYRGRRYARDLDEPSLAQRTRDLFLNQLVLNTDAKIGLPAMNQEGMRWMELWTHMLEEAELRGLMGPKIGLWNFLKESPRPAFGGDIAKRAAAAVAATSMPSSPYLVRYGKREHLRRFLEHGEFQVRSAAFYNDASLNTAVRDDELRLELFPFIDEAIETPPSMTGASVLAPRLARYLRLAIEMKTNFYVYCLSTVFAPRLFVDFEVDACLIIKDPARFCAGLKSTFVTHNPGWSVYDKPVEYIDPLNPTTLTPPLPFAKHFRHAYQMEHRIAWIPQVSKKQLDLQSLSMEPLHDYCQLVEI